MPGPQASLQPLSFFDLLPRELQALVSEWGWPTYRAQQITRWVYADLQTDPAGMTDLPKACRELLRQRQLFATADVIHEQISTDGTRKLLLGWGPDRCIETVMIPEGPRRTACVSCQFGCPVGCRFCASGIGGCRGNLSAGQMVQQVFLLNRRLHPTGSRITHVVFMGTGEPLANYAELVKAVRILHDPAAMHLGARHMTISTVGVPGRIRDLAHEALPVNLALSLHAPVEDLRRELIPWAEHFPLEQIIESLQYYFQATGREITLEYILLADVNDRPEHRRALACICRRLRCNVNLIPYNPVPGLPFRRPQAASVRAFLRFLREQHVNAHLRRSRGSDIDAACGQLRRRAVPQAISP